MDADALDIIEILDTVLILAATALLLAAVAYGRSTITYRDTTEYLPLYISASTPSIIEFRKPSHWLSY